MTLTVKYQTNRGSDQLITENWTINGRGWIIRPKGIYFVLPQYVKGLIDVLLNGKIISSLPLINKERLYYIKAIPTL